MSATLTAAVPGARRGGILDRAARGLLHRRLAVLAAGRLTVADRHGAATFGAAGDPLAARIEVRDPRFYRRCVLGGSLGFAESYLRGEWETPDLAAVLRVFARNVTRHGAGRWTHAALARPLARLAHALRRNTRSGSRRNIRDHYDLGNDFYRLFLDPTLTYSSALFAGGAATLEAASTAKLERACRALGLGPEHHVLEIGTGWGSFALHAAGRHGCRVTTTTISAAQRELAQRRVEEAGLAGRVEVLGADYRDLGGSYDRVVSIEMIEAVGHDHLAAFFDACAARLRPDGAMLLQAIVIPEDAAPAYRRSVDFIQRYVFPGSALPALSDIVARAGRHPHLGVRDAARLGPHYAETLRRWRAAFLARLPAVRALGFDQRFVRLWSYYLSYCEAGFEEGACDVMQLVLAGPAWRMPDGVPKVPAVPWRADEGGSSTAGGGDRVSA